MAGTIRGRDGAISAINVTPFVDIVLVLLVVLMVTAVQVVRGSIAVQLPSAASAGQAVPSTLNIVITDEGLLMMDGQACSEEYLIAQVRAQSANSPEVQAVIAADQAVAYQRVMRVIDLVKSNGVTSFALEIERKGVR